MRRAEINKRAELANEETLSPKGEKEVQNLATASKGANIQAIITSTEPRALATTASLSKQLNVPVIQRPDLAERNFGDWNTLPWNEIKEKLDVLTPEERYTFVPPNGESWQQMETRLRGALDWIAEQAYTSVAIVTHWGPIRVLLPLIEGEPRDSTLNLQVENGQYFTLQYQK